MAFSIPAFSAIRNTILQEIRNLTGITAPPDSDAAIRADGTASVVDGLYSYFKYMQRQLFVATADEPFLYLHAARVGVPRLAGTTAGGTVTALSNVSVTIPDGSKLTDGKGFYWLSVGAVTLDADVPKTINVAAAQVGASWNTTAAQLNWVSPPAGVRGTADVISIAGGSDGEALETWRARILERQQLGISRDREADIVAAMRAVAGVQHVFPYPKRRGLGSFDVAITGTGSPPVLPSAPLLAAAQDVLDETVGFYADTVAFAPTEQAVNVTAVISGTGSTSEVETVIRGYFAELAPGATYQAAILITRILAVDGVTDVVLTPATNIVPEVSWMYVKWLRVGTVAVTTA